MHSICQPQLLQTRLNNFFSCLVLFLFLGTAGLEFASRLAFVVAPIAARLRQVLKSKTLPEKASPCLVPPMPCFRQPGSPRLLPAINFRTASKCDFGLGYIQTIATKSPSGLSRKKASKTWIRQLSQKESYTSQSVSLLSIGRARTWEAMLRSGLNLLRRQQTFLSRCALDTSLCFIMSCIQLLMKSGPRKQDASSGVKLVCL